MMTTYYSTHYAILTTEGLLSTQSGQGGEVQHTDTYLGVYESILGCKYIQFQ